MDDDTTHAVWKIPKIVIYDRRGPVRFERQREQRPPKTDTTYMLTTCNHSDGTCPACEDWR